MIWNAILWCIVGAAIAAASSWWARRRERQHALEAMERAYAKLPLDGVAYALVLREHWLSEYSQEGGGA